MTTVLWSHQIIYAHADGRVADKELTEYAKTMPVVARYAQYKRPPLSYKGRDDAYSFRTWAMRVLGGRISSNATNDLIRCVLLVSPKTARDLVRGVIGDAQIEAHHRMLSRRGDGGRLTVYRTHQDRRWASVLGALGDHPAIAARDLLPVCRKVRQYGTKNCMYFSDFLDTVLGTKAAQNKGLRRVCGNTGNTTKAAAITNAAVPFDERALIAFSPSYTSLFDVYDSASMARLAEIQKQVARDLPMEKVGAYLAGDHGARMTRIVDALLGVMFDPKVGGAK